MNKMDKETHGPDIMEELRGRIMKDNPNAPKKEFNLLYKASEDGCSLGDFQRKCLKKGPTITVLYGKDGTVFGGYTRKSWTAEKKKVTRDSRAFLFYRRPGDSMKFLELDPEYYDYAITRRKDWGPTFGYPSYRGYDLQVFKEKNVRKNDDCFKLSGSLNFNNVYKTNESGFDKKSINGGGLDVKDLEVYQVEDDIDFTVITRRKAKVMDFWFDIALNIFDTIIRVAHTFASDNTTEAAGVVDGDMVSVKVIWHSML